MEGEWRKTVKGKLEGNSGRKHWRENGGIRWREIEVGNGGGKMEGYGGWLNLGPI